MQNLQGKIIIVTGAAQGMGAATVAYCAAAGAIVIGTDINEAGGAKAMRECGDSAWFFHHDVTREEQWQELVQTALARHGRIDGLVNNAAIFQHAPIEQAREADFRKLIDIDLLGPWLGMKAVVPAMKAARRGAIVNISSVEGLTGQSGNSAYTAAKWGMRGMSRTVTKEVGPFGVRVNTIHPGAIDTPMLRNGMGDVPFNDVFPLVALSRVGKPEEVAAATAFLLSDDASYISGAELVVDGGWTAGEYVTGKPAPE